MKSSFRVPVLFFACLAAAFLLMDRNVHVYDEGIILTGAMRVFNGDLIHRDFYANYGPGSFYVLAGLFHLFGSSVLVERWYEVAVRAAITVLVYVALRDRVRPRVAAAATLTSGLWLWTAGSHAYPIFPTLFFALLAAHLFAGALARHRPAQAAWAGACVAAATLFRYDVGLTTLVGLGAGAVIAWYAQPLAERSQSIKNEVRAMAGTAAGLVLLLLLVYAATGALGDMLDDVVFFPLDGYARARGLPFPTLARLWQGSRLSLLGVYLPFVAWAAGAFALWRTARDEQAGQDAARGDTRTMVALLIPLSMTLYLKGLGRPSVDHMLMSLVASIVLLALTWQVLSVRRDPRVLRALAVLGVLNFAAATVNAWHMGHYGNCVFRDVPQQGLGALSQKMEFLDPDRANAVTYVRSHAIPGDRLYVGTTRHDRIFVNDVSAYFITGHQPATKWQQFDPGVQTRAYIQAAMVKDLQASKPGYVWLDSGWDEHVEPNESTRSSGVYLLDRYLHWAYEPVEQFGSILILRRREAALPAAAG